MAKTGRMAMDASPILLHADLVRKSIGQDVESIFIEMVSSNIQKFIE